MKMGCYSMKKTKNIKINKLVKRGAYPVLVLEGRGFSKSSLDSLQPLPERPEEQAPLSYYKKLPPTRGETRGEYNADSIIDTDTLLSPPSSPTITRNSLHQSTDSLNRSDSLSESNSWSVSTGNLTGRTSVYSWGNDDEFDRQASATVRQMFQEIENLLFERDSNGGSEQLRDECCEWASTFPHFRLLGRQLLQSDDDGTQVILPNLSYLKCFDTRPTTAVTRPATAVTAITLDDVETEHLTGSYQGLSISGHRIEPELPPRSSSSEYTSSNQYAYLEQEIFAEDGDIEEFFAYDEHYVDTSESSYQKLKDRDERKNQRYKLFGYPPVTPNAHISDSIISECFDQLWDEVISVLKDVIRFYAERLLKDIRKQLLPSHLHQSVRHLETSSLRPFSRESRVAPISSQMRLKTASGTFTTVTDPLALQELMQIRSVPLQQRAPSVAAMPSRDDESIQMATRDNLRPVSSNPATKTIPRPLSMRNSDHQLYNRMSAKTPKRIVRLQPLQPMDRSKTPGFQDNDVIGEVVRGTRLATASDRLSPNAFPTVSPQPWGARNGALPPIERFDSSDAVQMSTKDRTKSEKQRSIQFSTRASSAATDESSRRIPYRERVSNLSDSRPNTTHTFRSESLYHGNKRQSTPGNNMNNSSNQLRGNNLASNSSNASLGVLQGVSLAIGGSEATHGHGTNKTVSFDDDVEEFDNLVLWDIPRQQEEYEVIYGTRRNAECHITSILRAGVEYLFYYTPNSQS